MRAVAYNILWSIPTLVHFKKWQGINGPRISGPKVKQRGILSPGRGVEVKVASTVTAALPAVRLRRSESIDDSFLCSVATPTLSELKFAPPSI